MFCYTLREEILKLGLGWFILTVPRIQPLQCGSWDLGSYRVMPEIALCCLHVDLVALCAVFDCDLCHLSCSSNTWRAAHGNAEWGRVNCPCAVCSGEKTPCVVSSLCHKCKSASVPTGLCVNMQCSMRTHTLVHALLNIYASEIISWTVAVWRSPFICDMNSLKVLLLKHLLKPMIIIVFLMKFWNCLLLGLALLSLLCCLKKPTNLQQCCKSHCGSY